jgi:hypothetical protein
MLFFVNSGIIIEHHYSNFLFIYSTELHRFMNEKYGTVPKSIKKSQKKEEILIILKHKYTTAHFPVLVQARL